MVEAAIKPRTKEGFRVKTKIQRQLRAAKRRIARRLDKSKLGDCSRPVLAGGNLQFEMAERTRGMTYGGLGAIVLLVRQLGLAEAIDRDLHLLKIHLPYHESDHVLNLAYNALCDGTCLEDIELRRNDEVFLDALGARRIPDPTTAGDFCRRFRPQRRADALGRVSRHAEKSLGAAAGGNRLCGQRPLRSREPAGAAQGRGAGLARAGG